MPLTELGELEAFLALSEELHFARAAERLGLSRPRVSQLIQSLERRVGGRLFDRTSRRVALTPSGRFLLDRVKPSFEGVRRAIEETRAYARELRIGFLGPFLGAVDAAVTAFRATHPGWPVSMTETRWGDYFGPLRRAEVDLLVSIWPVRELDLTTGPVIAEYPRVLAVAADHPLARRESVDADELSAYTMVELPRATPSEVREGFLPPSTPDGRPIARGGEVKTQHEMLSRVATSREVCPTSTALMEAYRHPGVRFLPLTGLPPARAVVSWRTAGESAGILEFVASLPSLP
ncbi:LysR family transcriptional regulator [Streptomyces sp. PTM05]|uniref:LysR family transcriptional regulator n=1 Tax=Streptantibioticus parmotrematis TaxID=2873249 RepID=A0ABS7R157_9ACTN|nr:LysR family transcriptional regulator [Streptantibioticus parmotrematis]MBY8887747.1 LysR family transcriptional regulator [Streptantibioticus parmotrematis]